MSENLVDQARAQVFQARERRVTLQAESIRRQKEMARPTAYGGARRVRGLGADGPWRPSSNQMAGGAPIGAPIGYAAGVATSQPALGGRGGNGGAIATLEETVRRYAAQFGAILSSVEDPNASQIRPRHNADILGSIESGIWLWNVDAGEWEPMPTAEPPSILRQANHDPNLMGEPIDVPFFFDTKALRLFVSDSLAIGPLDWYPTGSKSWIVGSGPQPDRAYPGDSVTNSDGQMFVMNTNGAWLMLCTSCEDTPSTTPPPFGHPGSTWY